MRNNTTALRIENITSLYAYCANSYKLEGAAVVIFYDIGHRLIK